VQHMKMLVVQTSVVCSVAETAAGPKSCSWCSTSCLRDNVGKDSNPGAFFQTWVLGLENIEPTFRDLDWDS